MRLVNAAYTSQTIPGTSHLGKRDGDRLYCPHPGGVVWDADHAAAINLLDRDADPDIGLHAPYTRGGRSCWNGLIANGPDCRTRTPTPT